MVRYPILIMGKPTPPEWKWLRCRNCPYRFLCEAYEYIEFVKQLEEMMGNKKR